MSILEIISYSFNPFIYTAALEKSVMSSSSSVQFSYNGVNAGRSI